MTGTFVFTKPVEAAVGDNVTSVSSSPSGRSSLDILHMEKTVTQTGTDQFEVTLRSYLDDTSAANTPVDIVFVLDASTSMINGFTDHKDTVVSAVTNIVQSLQDIGGDHRVGYVAFGATIIENATTDSLLNINEALTAKKQTGTIFGNPIYASQTYLEVYSSTTGGSTAPYFGLERAQTLLSDNDGRIKMCVLVTDGAPGIFAFDPLFADYAIASASEMKAAGITMFAIQTNFTYDWSLTSSQEAQLYEYFSRVTSYYGADATSLDNSCSPDYESNLREAFVVSADNTDELVRTMITSIINSKTYPYIINGTAYTQDLVTPYFTISNATYSIDTPNFNSSTKALTGWTTGTSKSANVSGQRVYVTGFEYAQRAVSYINKDRAARLTIKYTIKPITNFFGGNSVPTSVPGTVNNNDYTKYGSGVYCNGMFLKSFNNIPVNITIKDRTITAKDATVTYGTSVDLDDYYAINDLTTSANFLNGINNKFVNVTYTVSSTINSVGGTSSSKTYSITAGQNYEESALNSFGSKYPVTSQEGDRITVSYKITPIYSSAQLGTATTVQNSVKSTIKTVLTYGAEFKFVGEYLDEIAVSKPANQIGITKAKAEELPKTVSPTAGYKYSTDSAEYYFSGWSLVSTPTVNSDGEVIYYYEGSWSKVEIDNSTGYFINIYVMDENGNYPTAPESMFVSDATIGETVYLEKNLYYDDEIYQFSYCGNAVNNTVYKNSIVYNLPEQIGEIGINENIENYINGEITDAYFVRYFAEVYGMPQIELPISTAACHLCAECGSLLYMYAEYGNIYWCDNCNGWIAESIYYSNYVINTSKTTSQIELVDDLNSNVLNVYVDRVPHTVSLTVNYDDGAPSKTYTFTNYHGASFSENTIFSSDENEYQNYINFAYADESLSTFVEDTPYYEATSYFSFPLFYTTIVDGVEKLQLENQSGFYLADVFEYGYLFNDTMPAYDMSSVLNLSRSTYDLTVTKEWSSNVSQKDLQSCIFGLYEVDDLGNYNLVTRFAIGVDEFSWSSSTLSAQKTIKGLIAGKTYVVEEETWSYKTESDWNRESTNNNVVFNSTSLPVSKTCTNSPNDEWSYTPTVEKGIRNYYVRSVDKTYAQSIKKNVAGGRK